VLVFVGGFLWMRATEEGSLTNAVTGKDDSSMGAMLSIFFVIVILGSFPLFSGPEWDLEPMDFEVEVEISKKSKMLGNPDAKISVVEFIDFGCGHCAKAAPAVKQAVEKYGDNVRLFQRNFPLFGCPIDDGKVVNPSCLLAVSVECASSQGKFWELSSRIFSKQSSFNRVASGEDFLPHISDLGLDEDTFVACVNDVEMVGFVEKDIKLSEKYRVTGTPAIFIHGLDGEKIFKVKSWDSLDKIIEKSLAGEVPPENLGTSD